MTYRRPISLNGMRSRRTFGLLLSQTLIFSAVVPAQETDPVEELRRLCESVLCYPPGDVRVRLEDGEVAEFGADYPYPIVQNDVVVIFPGFTVFIEAEIADERFVNLRAVEEPGEMTGVLKLEMYQDPDSADTFLTVTNYLEAALKYRAGMMLPEGDDIYSTSSCAVLTDGIFSTEHWPYPIFQLILDDFRVYSDTETVRCE